MAKITRDKPQTPAKVAPTGPVLVEESPIESEIPAEDEPEQEEATEAETSAAPPDPRRIPPAIRMEGREFWAFLQQHPAPQDLDLYVYRLFPVVKSLPPPGWNSNQKPPTYCEKVKGVVTQQTGQVADYEWLRNVRGSGNYHLRVVERALKRTQNRQICECILEINEYDTHMPVLNDWCELVPNASGNQWIIQRLLQDKVIKRTPEGGFVAADGQHQNGTAATDPGAMLTQTVNLAKDLARTMQPKESPSAFSGKDIVDLIKSNAAQNDPQRVIDAAKGLVEISKPAEAPKPDNTVINLLIEQMKTEREERAAQRQRERDEATTAREREFKLMEKLMEANKPTPAADPDVQLTKTFDLLAKAKEFIGEGGSSKMNGWQEFLKDPITELMGALKQFAQPIGMVVAANIAQKQQAQQQAARPASQPAPAQVPAAAPANGQPAQPAAAPAPDATAQPAAEQAQPQQMDPNVQGVMVVIGAVLQQIDLTLRDHFEHAAAGDEGYSGEDFAMWFCDNRIAVPPPYNMLAPNGLSGSEALDRIRKFSANDPQGNFVPAPEAGRQVILAAYRQNPVTWQSICPTEERAKQFETFITEFLSYDPEAPEPAAPPAKGKRA